MSVAFILIIQISPGVILVLVWLKRSPRQNIGRGFSLHAEKDHSHHVKWHLFDITT
jgi:hypothetical protein